MPLAERDAATRAALAALYDLPGMIDVPAATAAWDATLLAVQGRLSAVIDFGCLGGGNPACDLIVARNLCSTDIGRHSIPCSRSMTPSGRAVVAGRSPSA